MNGTVKGWCPGAHRPMASGDGLIVRVRPHLARLDAAQVLALCDVAQRFGNGEIGLTNRANLQVRAIAEADHPAVLEALEHAVLLDTDPQLEARRNLIVAPLWRPGDATPRLAEALTRRLGDLPPLPAKVGFAIDAGPARMLTNVSADIRLERGRDDALIVRADGAPGGRPAREDTAIDAAIEMAVWLADRLTADKRRMAALSADVPKAWTAAAPGPASAIVAPGPTALGCALGAPFGQVDANALARIMRETGARGVRITPWRTLLLEDVARVDDPAFIVDPNDPILRVDACPGAPACTSATVTTRPLARALAGKVDGTLHVSGCAKGCAHAGAADVTLVGRAGGFDLIRHGRADAAPIRAGLPPAAVAAALEAR